MFKLAFASLATLLFSHAASANIYVNCGDWQNDEISKSVFQISAENDSDLKGPVGNGWFVKFGGEEWIESGEISAKKTKKAGIVTVTVTVVDAHGISDVGTQWVLTDLYGSPVLEKFTMGGFAGTVNIGHWDCENGND